LTYWWGHFYLAILYAERGYATVSHLSVCLSVCPSMTFKYDFPTRWNMPKIIAQPNSFRLMHLVTPTWEMWSNGNLGNFGGD